MILERSMSILFNKYMHEYEQEWDKWVLNQPVCWVTCCQSASTGPSWRPAGVCRHENWAHGRLLEMEVCSPQLFFHSLPWEVRRWGDKLLTTLRNPPHPPSLCHRGAALMGGKASHRLTSPCFWTSLTLPASSLPAQHLAFKFSPPPPHPTLPRSHLPSCQSGSVLWGLFIYNSGVLKRTRNVKISTSGELDEMCSLVFAAFINI